MLEGAGVKTTLGVREDAARTQLNGYLTRCHLGRPEVTLKLATTLDGKIATASGESRWITGSHARRNVHLERSMADAVVVGIGTALADDPMLDVREMGLTNQPVRVVVDSNLRLPAGSRLMESARSQPVWILHGPDKDRAKGEALASRGARLLPVQGNASGQLDLAAALRELGNVGLTRIYCEGGGRLAANLLRADLVDRVTLYGAGKMIGNDGIGAVGNLGLENLAQAPRFRLLDARPIGEDVVSDWVRNAPPWEGQNG